jgi:uncharacterized membrane protein YdjX (TVP38/TMEM64 family)
MEQATPTPRWLTALALLGLCALAVLGATQLDRMVLLLEWVRSAGPQGLLVFAAVYLLCTLLMAPASFLQGSAGFLFGPGLGFVIASAASVACGGVAFVLGRTVLRDVVARRVANDPRFASIDNAIGEGGLYLVVLLRLSPLSPFNIFNYGLGLTRVSTREFLLGTWIGSIPAVFLYSYLGSTVGSLADLAEGQSTANPTAQVLVLACTLVASVLVARFAQKALKRALATTS